MSTAWLNRILMILAGLGLFVALFLSIAYLDDRQIPCGMHSDCDILKKLDQAKWGGLPVPVYGLMGYAILFVLAAIRTFGSEKLGRLTVKLGLGVAGVGSLISFNLIGQLLNELHLSCQWCMASATIMFATLIIYIFFYTQERYQAPQSLADQIMVPTIAVLALGSATLFASTRVPSKDVKLDVFSVSTFAIPKYRLKGNSLSKVTVIEIADFYCPACRTVSNTLPEILTKYPGIQVGFIHLPLYEKEGHENSLAASVAAEIAGDHDKFWEFSEYMWSDAGEEVRNKEGLIAILEQLGIEGAEARKRLDDQNDPAVDKLLASFEAIRKYGVNQTPVFVIVLEGRGARILDRDSLNKVLENDPEVKKALAEGARVPA